MRKLTAYVLTLLMLLCVIVPATATNDPQHIYSNAANSGVRHEVCTTLDGTTVETYYTGDYTFETLSAMSGDALLQVLRTLMVSTHSYQTSYDECRDLSVITDCENGDGTSINLLYSSFVTDRKGYINDTSKGWNREHVWPKSLGGFNTSGAGSDLHHIRPTDKSINGTRGNEKYGIPANGGSPVTGTVTVAGAVGGYSDNTYFQPLDNVKGDVARICLYVYVRYGGELSKCSEITNVFQSVDVLLQWHAEDPVDTWEMGRNEVVYAIQGNRNVFIDYPELAWDLFNKEMPEDVVTPSSGDSSCTHANVETRDAVDATCSTEGHTGDVYCADCGAFVAGGSVIPANGEHNYSAWEVTKMPTESEKGSQRRECTICGYEQIADIAAVVDGNATTGPGNSSLVLPDATTPEKAEENTGNALVIVGIVVGSVVVVGAAIAIPTIILSKKKAK